MNDPLLLDTHVVIWIFSASDRISVTAKRAMSRSTAALSVSVVSVWEIVLKYHARRLRLSAALEEVVDQILYRSPWSILPVRAEHLPAMAALPVLHKDPFDRLLIAQARHEGMAILTTDEHIRKYDVRTVW